MIGVITGDIIGSRDLSGPQTWLIPLKTVLRTYGENPKDWDIYRGDSFQLEVDRPENTFLIAVHIKAAVKQIKGMDIRMAIGIGDKSYDAQTVSESSGEAFVHSGELLDQVNRNDPTLTIRTPWKSFDREMNLFFRFALIAMDDWSQSSAEIVELMIANPGETQQELGKRLSITQHAVSGRVRRSQYSVIEDLAALFREKVGYLACQ